MRRPSSFLPVLLAAGTLLAAAAASARADTDGYYCVGRGYLAVEFATPKAKTPHVLKVARFDGRRGPRWAGQVTLVPFQAHALSCEDDRVVLHGQGPGGPVAFVVPLSPAHKPGRPVRGGSDLPPPVSDVQRPTPNLGNWATPGTVPLPTPANAKAARQFQLHLTRTSQRLVPTGLRHHNKTVLEEVDGSGRVKRSLQLFKGTLVDTSAG